MYNCHVCEVPACVHHFSLSRYCYLSGYLSSCTCRCNLLYSTHCAAIWKSLHSSLLLDLNAYVFRDMHPSPRSFRVPARMSFMRRVDCQLLNIQCTVSLQLVHTKKPLFPPPLSIKTPNLYQFLPTTPPPCFFLPKKTPICTILYQKIPRPIFCQKPPQLAPIHTRKPPAPHELMSS